MKIAIIVAMKKELSLILSLMPDYKEIYEEEFTVYSGRLGSHDIIAAQCGIGKVNSALRTSRIISGFAPDLVINSGVAGGVDETMSIGSVLVADRVSYHDVWCGPGTDYGVADGCPQFFMPSAAGMDVMKELAALPSASDMRFGLLCSGDIFISRPEEVRSIKSRFPDALGCDMESASIAQTCFKAGVPFMIIRVMSDMPGGGENISEYRDFWNEAPARTFGVVSDFINRLPMDVCHL